VNKSVFGNTKHDTTDGRQETETFSLEEEKVETIWRPVSTYPSLRSIVVRYAHSSIVGIANFERHSHLARLS
jgi:hypothetical protein